VLLSNWFETAPITRVGVQQLVFGRGLYNYRVRLNNEVIAIYRSLVSLSLLLTLLTVILSAYIRLAEVGIGCEGWPGCYGQLDAGVEKKGITVLTEEGQNMAHYGARVAHRYIASVLGLFILGIFIAALRQGAARRTTFLVPLAIFAITVFLSLLGYYTPTRSNPLITMGNLLGGMALLALLWWLMQREAGEVELPLGSQGMRRLAVFALCLVSLQVVLGGWSSANYASASCPGLVRCEGDILATGQVGDAFNPMRRVTLDDGGQVVRTDSLGLISMTHRVFAILTAAYLAWMVRRLKPQSLLRGTLLALSAFSISQILVGVTSIWFAMPLMAATSARLKPSPEKRILPRRSTM
jgi:cytochrome c oxidase assembly protein subunit 15